MALAVAIFARTADPLREKHASYRAADEKAILRQLEQQAPQGHRRDEHDARPEHPERWPADEVWPAAAIRRMSGRCGRPESRALRPPSDIRSMPGGRDAAGSAPAPRCHGAGAAGPQPLGSLDLERALRDRLVAGVLDRDHLEHELGSPGRASPWSMNARGTGTAVAPGGSSTLRCRTRPAASFVISAITS